MNDPQRQPLQDESPAKRTVLGDVKTLKNEFRAETDRAGRSAAKPRFRLSAAFAFYWVYAAAVYGILGFILRALAKFPGRAILYAAAAVFLAGNLCIAVTYYCKKRYGALVEMTAASAVRTGIPLLAVLAFYLSFDKITFRAAVLSLAAFYVLSLPFEVWIGLPGRAASAEESGIAHKKDETKK